MMSEPESMTAVIGRGYGVRAGGYGVRAIGYGVGAIGNGSLRILVSAQVLLVLTLGLWTWA